jgi:tryptophan synthase alpha chain
MSRIAATFDALKKQGRKALIPFATAGDPDPALTVPLLHAFVEAGADILEVGVPFSDPMADGPVIQRASERALAHKVSLVNVLGMVREFRKKDAATPIVLMGYANPVEAMGIERFVAAAKTAGVDGVLIVDYPPEECAQFAALAKKHGIDPIFLLAPTSTPERILRVASVASGFVYYVSLRGVTGAGHLDIEDVVSRVPRLRDAIKLPIGVGFGIRDAESARRIAVEADAVVIASKLIEEIEQAGPQHALARAKQVLKPIREALG